MEQKKADTAVMPPQDWSLHHPLKGPEKSLPRVLVLGAGMSGLIAARILSDSGFPVRVIEARERLGGRIWTDTRLGAPCDLGASWIHGARNNPLTSWCRSRGIKTGRIPKGRIRFYKRGEAVPLSSLIFRARRGMLRATWAYFQTWFSLRCRKSCGGAYGDTSISQTLNRILESPRLPEEDRLLLRWFLGLMEMFNGAPADSLGILEQDLCEYRQFNLVPLGGFKTLIDDATCGLTILLKTPVLKVAYGPHGVRIRTNRGIFSGDLAVVTLPVGVLRSREITFDPPLPASKQKALSRVGYGGVLNKVVFRFPRRFWPPGHQRLAALPARADRQGIFHVWADFSPAMGFPALAGFAGGGFAAYLDQHATDQQVCHEALSILGRMFPPGLPSPRAHALTRWRSDPWARGSYSYGAVGDNRTERKALAAPVADRLFFAGEATHEKHYGTVHGALLTGEREALRIHRRFCCPGETIHRLPWHH